jgi:proline iminopeptidase
MMPLYSFTYDSAARQPGLNRVILSHDAINVAFGGFLRSYNLLDQLNQITSPTLVLAGRHDWICAPEFSEEIAHKIPHANLRIFENSGHLIRVDEPEALRSAIVDFYEANFDLVPLT